MSDAINPIELARELAAIAGTTTDPETARLLLEIVNRLLSGSGLPSADDEDGGGDLPGGWVPNPQYEAA
jgi:hypothetical protein